jgi:hypothetical protein
MVYPSSPANNPFVHNQEGQQPYIQTLYPQVSDYNQFQNPMMPGMPPQNNQQYFQTQVPQTMQTMPPQHMNPFYTNAPHMLNTMQPMLTDNIQQTMVPQLPPHYQTNVPQHYQTHMQQIPPQMPAHFYTQIPQAQHQFIPFQSQMFQQMPMQPTAPMQTIIQTMFPANQQPTEPEQPAEEGLNDEYEQNLQNFRDSEMGQNTNRMLTIANELVSFNTYDPQDTFLMRLFSTARMRVFIPMLGTLSAGSYMLLERFHWSAISANSLSQMRGRILLNQGISSTLQQLGMPGRHMLFLSSVGATTFAASIYFLAAARKEWKELQAIQKEHQNLSIEWDINKSTYAERYRDAVEEAKGETEKLLRSMRSDKMTQIALLILGAGSSAVISAGCYTGSGLLIQAGGTAAALAATGAFIKSVINSATKPREKLAVQLDHSLKSVLNTSPLEREEG